MVRETRHLWVGNLPDNIREDRIREHFKRYGRVQNVKLLGRAEASSTMLGATAAAGGSGVCATVAFMDIKSAAKAHNAEHVLEDKTLTTEYYEPAAIPSTAGAPSAGSSPAGSGYSGSSSSVNSSAAPASATAAATATVAAAATVATARYHLTEPDGTASCTAALVAAAPANWRGTNDSASEYCRRGNTPSAYGRYTRTAPTAPYATPPSGVDRTPHHRWYGGSGGGESTPSTPGGGGTPAGDGGGRRRRRSGSGGASHSSRSSSTSREPSSDSRASTPTVAAAAVGASAGTSPATPLATTPSSQHNHRPSQTQWSSTASGRPLAICVRNLPTRSSDSSLKDGLYHEYKKHGKVVWVKVVGQNADRYAVVRFKKPSDVEKALEVSQDKLFFGCKISVAPHQSCDEDAESAKPYETDIDEFHPKATRTLFIGNLEKDVTQQQLREKFKHFGRIIEIDIKKGSGGGSGYAFCQYASIASVVEAIRAMDGEYVGGSRVKLGFGKPVATACVWIDGLTEHTEKQVVSAVSRCGTATSVCVDRAAGAALVHFEQASAASAAVRELRRLAAQVSSDPDQRRLMVDYASRECQEAFYEQLEKHGGTAALAGSERLSGDLSTRYIPSTRHDTLRYDGCGARSRAPSYGRGSSRTPRYTGLEHYDPADYAADRRYRVFDDLGSSPQIEDGSYEERLQSVVVSPHRARRHRRDSSSDEHKHSKERHRSGGTRRSSGELRHRSRSGSRSEHRRRGSDSERRRHRRRRDESGSRAGTPLCDELPEGPAPAEPRRPPQPRDRSHLPMSLPLPKFAAQVLRSVASNAPPLAPTTAPASPPRPPSASSSSGSSAPHSPSLEERIRSLDEKYEKWSGSRIAAAEAAERGRFRHRLLEIDINEVKPSEVVRSLLAKRSVFDEDSERLEGTALQRPPSPTGSPQPKTGPRALQYPFPTHTSSAVIDGAQDSEERVPPNGFTTKILRDRLFETMKSECKKNLDNLDTSVANLEHRINSRSITTLDPILDDPRLNRHDRFFYNERMSKLLDPDNKQEKTDVDLRRLSIEKVHFDSLEKCHLKSESDHIEVARDPRIEAEKRRREIHSKDMDYKTIDTDTKIEKYHKSSRLFPELYRNDKYIVDAIDTTLSKKETVEHSLAMLHSERKSFSKENLHCVSPKIVEYNHTQDAIEHGRMTIKEEKSVKCELGLDVLDKKPAKEIGNVAIRSDKSLLPEDTKKNKLFTQSMIHLDRAHSNLSHDKEACVDVKEKLDLKSISDQQHSTIDLKLENIQEVDNVIKRQLSTENEEKQSCVLLESDKIHKINASNQEDNTEKDVIHPGSAIMPKLECNRNQTARRSSEDKVTTDKEELRKTQKENQDSEKDSKEVNSFKMDKSGEQIDKEKRNKDDLEKDKSHVLKPEKEKFDKEKESKVDKETEKPREKANKEMDKVKNIDDKTTKHEHRKDKIDKDRKKDHIETNDHVSKSKKEEHKHKHDRHKKDHNDTKRENKKDAEPKTRKSSRDENARELCRKDSTDSSASRTSHDSLRTTKDSDTSETREDGKLKTKVIQDSIKHKVEKGSKSADVLKLDDNGKTKLDVKDDRENYSSKIKGENLEKQRHYSVDSPSLDSKRKERLNSCSSLPSNIGYKRRMSSQDSIDSLIEESKKSKLPERRDSKDSRFNEKHKTTKFSKCHFAKLLESKTKDDKKNQVKPPDDNGWKDNELKEIKSCNEKSVKKSPKDLDEKLSNEKSGNDIKHGSLQDDIDFLATLELRSSEEDEKQKALKKEMKEKKRIQQLQQIQELQMQQDALQQTDNINKIKDDKRAKTEEKKKESAREKRMSTERKSRDDKIDGKKSKCRKQLHSSDTSDSDEPKKHSIFDIVDDEPTYISMYDKVKARSCKNMQKQEEEKRQEKIKAKFSQLKQSRAKREEKKRSSWDEDSDSDHDKKRLLKVSVASSSEDERAVHNKKRDKGLIPGIEYDNIKNHDRQNYFSVPSIEEDSKNKLCRKGFRTRIMSDTSDDELLKTSRNKNITFQNDMRKDLSFDCELPAPRVPQECDLYSKSIKDDVCNNITSAKVHDLHRIRKNNILNLFQNKTDYDIKMKDNSLDTDDDGKINNTKIVCTTELSSESESITSNKFCINALKKLKKKQKKSKPSISEDETKESVDYHTTNEGEVKHKHTEKVRKHGSKKEKRRDKNRESLDVEEIKDDKTKIKKTKNILTSEGRQEHIMNSLKREGKMEDIFGPLSDESDSGVKAISEPEKNELICDFTCNIQLNTNTCEEVTSRDKDDLKRKKEKKKKEKRYVSRDDENSLDVDAAGRAIEAQLFAESAQDCVDPIEDCETDHDENIYKYMENTIAAEKHIEKQKKECKERKKKKKKNREDRQSRKDHHQYQHNEKLQIEKKTETSNSEILIDVSQSEEIVILDDSKLSNSSVKTDISHTFIESPSLPRLTDSPPTVRKSLENVENNDTGILEIKLNEEETASSVSNSKSNDQKVSTSTNNDANMINTGFSSDYPHLNQDKNKTNTLLSSFDTDIDQKLSENAVRSISEFETPLETSLEKTTISSLTVSPTAEEKSDEKARAVISQEETEDAVAALLGESFGGKDRAFGNRYNEVEQPAVQMESTCLENENLREEDAEEMRRAVQNLNASEMEMKPDTPMSDNDLLLIDTDNEEGDDSQQDATDRLPVNIIATNPSLTTNSNQTKCSESNSSDLFVDNKSVPTSVQAAVSNDSIVPITKSEEVNTKFTSAKREILQQITSTATPVITSWTLTNNKLRDSRLICSPDNQLINKETTDNKSAQINTSIVHMKSSPNHNFTITNTPRAIISPPNRMTAPYQVINPIIRPSQVANMQPPTIKIPEPHLLYHKQQGIVISPRLASDARLQSPKNNSQNDGITSPRVANMAILNTSSQNINSIGIASPGAMQQRSPGHVTVVRMQQPPLSPIQTMHIPHGTRAMVSPNRPNSVLVQAQTTPIHFNRLPVTPVLAPLPKQLNSNLLQSKPTSATGVPIIHSQKIACTDARNSEQLSTGGLDKVNEHSKIILSPSNLQQSTNPTVMAQNRLISMQNAVHSGIHLPNKVVINNIAQLHESRDIVGQVFKSENSKSETIVSNHSTYSQSPVIHVTGVNPSTPSIIHNGPKSLLGQEVAANRTHVSNIIHSLNSQRLVTSTPITSVIQIDTSKCSPSVLSMANIRPQTVVTKFESPNANNLSLVTLPNSVMTPLLTKTSNAPTNKQIVSDSEVKETYSTMVCNDVIEYNNKTPENLKINRVSDLCDSTEKKENIRLPKAEVIAKCETDFEELLKDNTNEIKVTNTPDKKLEVNVGNIVTLISTNSQGKEEITSIQSPKKDNVTCFPEPSQINDEKNLNDSHVSKIGEKILETPLCEKREIDSTFDTSKEDSTKDASEFKEVVKQMESKIENFNKKEEYKLNDNEAVLITDDLKHQLENNDDTKDANIESVIKKIDTVYSESKDDNVDKNMPNKIVSNVDDMDISTNEVNDSLFAKETKVGFDIRIQKAPATGKRGGRGMRGKRSERHRDKVQTRQISKPARGTTASKRGRGRGRMDKKLKSSIGVATSSLPGDIYDFHEDSGDESKTESRPRLILTIKSPLSGQSSASATSSLSIATKEQKTPDKSQMVHKEDKNDEFVSPSPNTRKSRRLQEKDVQRNTVDDVIEDVIKNSSVQTRRGKEGSKKRPTRQVGHKVNYREKINLSDVRKSPRGTKRTRDRSSSEASIDSSDEKIARKEDLCRDMKLPKLTEATVVISKSEPEQQNTIKPSNTPVINTLPATTPTPIMKPPKKMISEISAKLASAFELTPSPSRSTTSPIVAEKPVEESGSGLTRVCSEPDKQPYREYRDMRNQECVKVLSRSEEILQATTAETPAESHTADVNFGRRLIEGVAGNAIPVGALEAADARVQSPALPHRPPSVHRPGPAPAAHGPAHAPAPADRATPILIRAGEGDIGVAGGNPGTGLGTSVPMGVGAGASVGVGVGAVPAPGGARAYRAPYVGTASLPRGAHHPPPPPLVAHPHHPLHAAHKQSPIVGSHHHTTAPPPGARVTITSVPSISPNSQMPMSADLVRSPPPAHQQTSPITPGDGVYSHFSHQHYQMFQQQFRVTLQENRTTPSPFTRSPMEAEGSEAPTPPLELRRPVSARVPRPAHSPSQADRLFSTHGGRSPPPAHGGAMSAGRVPAGAGAMPPHGPHGPPGPLHASQVPREADSLQMLLRRYPVMWQGLLALKNDCAAVQMHFVHGNPSVAGGTLPRHVDGSTPPLRIAQRMRLEPAQLEQVHRKMKMENEHCMLLALPCGRDHMDVLQQSNNLTAGFITYLQRKQAAGIVNVAPPGHHQAMYTVHIFPSCDFANENLNRIAPDLMHRVADIAHLLIVIATV